MHPADLNTRSQSAAADVAAARGFPTLAILSPALGSVLVYACFWFGSIKGFFNGDIGWHDGLFFVLVGLFLLAPIAEAVAVVLGGLWLIRHSRERTALHFVLVAAGVLYLGLFLVFVADSIGAASI